MTKSSSGFCLHGYPIVEGSSDCLACKCETLCAELEAARKENAQLTAALAKLRQVAMEIVRAHKDPTAPEYNQCDKARCHWCEQVEAIDSTALRDLLAPTIELLDTISKLPGDMGIVMRVMDELARLRELCGEKGTQ